MKQWPRLLNATVPEIVTVLREVLRTRIEDVADFDNLQNRFMAGRKVGKVPASSADIDGSDRIGDFNFDDDYFYLCVESSGAAVWRRISLASW